MTIKNKSYLLYRLGVTVFLLVQPFLKSHAQGLINNGAHIEIGTGTFLHIEGGASIGNFTNQDAGIFTGIVENQGTMEITGNWTNLSASNVFNSSSGSVFLSGANQFIQGLTPTYFHNLTLTGSGIKTLNIPTLTGGGFALPTGVLNLTSLPLDLNGNQLTINNPATTAITNTAGYIISETPAAFNPSIVQWNMGAINGIYIYPFGVAGVQIPVTLNKTIGNASVSISTRATPLPNNTAWESTVTNMLSAVVGGPGEIPVVIDRWWNVEPSAPVTANLSFSYRGIENTTTYNPLGTFSAQNWNGIQWLPPVGAGPGVLLGTAAVTTPAQILGNTPWVLSNLEAPLPIELIDLNTHCTTHENVEIRWTTGSEKNNNYFSLEKSMDGIHYQFLSRINSKGNSSVLQTYQYVDKQSGIENAYYRLSQTDFNGTTVFFDPVFGRSCKDKSNEITTAWVNDGIIYLLMKAEEKKNVNCILYDVEGRVIFNQLKVFNQGTTTTEFPVSALSKGVYFLSLRNNYSNHHFKLMIGK